MIGMVVEEGSWDSDGLVVEDGGWGSVSEAW